MDWKSFTDLMSAVPNKLVELREIPNRASDIADRAYPDSARDASTKNAYRHALGTGMWTQALGGGSIAAGLAKMAGYGWEGFSMLDPENRNSPAWREDMRHDLNANAIGSQVGTMTSNQQDLERVLRGFADRSVVRPAPAVLDRHPGYLTRAVR